MSVVLSGIAVTIVAGCMVWWMLRLITYYNTQAKGMEKYVRDAIKDGLEPFHYSDRQHTAEKYRKTAFYLAILILIVVLAAVLGIVAMFAGAR